MSKYHAFIIIGAPGSGKGTHSEAIKNRYGVAHISTGEMLRENVKKGSELGKKANEYMKKGELVPDEIIIGMVANRIKEDDCLNGFLLDGFPRTVEQANAIDKLLEDNKTSVSAVINLIVGENELIRRLIKRGRADDNEETIKNRLGVFNYQTYPVIEHYKKAGKLLDIEGEGDVETIEAAIMKNLDERDA